MGGKMSHAERGIRMSESQAGKKSQCNKIKQSIKTYEEKNCDEKGCTVNDEINKKVRNSLKARQGISDKCKKRINDKLDDIENRRKNIQPDIKF
jgi:hypothetical protein